jgi:GT2 family glycosyltransferase
VTAPAVSVIICAYTQARWDDLSSAIASAVAQPATREVLVVIDHEKELLQRARAEWDGPTVKVIPNRFRQGLSGARNTGARAATHDIVAFLDDDATAAEGWLGEMLDCFDSTDVVGVGGFAAPAWPGGTAPVMLPPELLWIVGCSYRGLPTRRADVRNVIGCSMAFRKQPLLDVGGFNSDTGRVGRIPLGGEETEMCIKLRQADPTARIVFEPRSSVSHRVTADRATWKYVARRSFYEGVSKSALSKSLGAQDALSSERSYTTRILPAGVWRELTHGRPAGAAAIVLSLAGAGFGYLYGDLHRRRTRRTLAMAPADETTAG